MFSVLMLYLSSPSLVDLFFFFNDTATTEIYTLSLHDALPISRSERRLLGVSRTTGRLGEHLGRLRDDHLGAVRQLRSEEHTSELQSQFHLVCRLLLEKKKKKQTLTTVASSNTITSHPSIYTLT